MMPRSSKQTAIAGSAEASTSAPYHHGGLRQVLLQQALRKIEEGGLAQLSLRALARDAGVSPTAPYRHFDSKRSLLAALAQQGFAGLTVEIRAALKPPAKGNPALNLEERFVALGLAYVRFAVANPTSYHLMFGSVIDDFSEYAELQSSADETFSILLDVLREVIAAGGGGGLDLDTLGGAIWSAVHGIASLQISDLRPELYRHKPLPADAQGPLVSVQALRADTEGSLRLLLRGALLGVEL